MEFLEGVLVKLMSKILREVHQEISQIQWRRSIPFMVN